MKNIFSLQLYCLCTLFVSISSSTQKLSDSDIREIYNTYVISNMNDIEKNRYNPLPMKKNLGFWPWEDKDLPRVIATLEFERFMTNNNINKCKKGLAINGIDPEWHYITSEQIVQIDYLEDQIKYDLHTLDLPEKDFDFVMCCQTMEHVCDPIRCLKSIYEHMEPGGILYINVPGNTIPHDTPIHFYNGFTSIGIGAMLKLAGFKILNIGQWGNKEYLSIMHKTSCWPDYRGFKHPVINEFDCSPVIVWAFACK